MTNPVSPQTKTPPVSRGCLRWRRAVLRRPWPELDRSLVWYLRRLPLPPGSSRWCCLPGTRYRGSKIRGPMPPVVERDRPALHWKPVGPQFHQDHQNRTTCQHQPTWQDSKPFGRPRPVMNNWAFVSRIVQLYPLPTAAKARNKPQYWYNREVVPQPNAPAHYG